MIGRKIGANMVETLSNLNSDHHRIENRHEKAFMGVHTVTVSTDNDSI